jgi:hypothetical protein
METKTTEIVKVVEDKVKNAIAESSMAVRSDEDMSKAATFLTNIKKLSKWIKQEKEKITKPLNEALKVERNRWAPFESEIEVAEDRLKKTISAYQNKKDAEIAKQQESIARRAEAGQLKPETAVAKMEQLCEQGAAVKTGEGTVAFSKVRKVRIVDESKIPRAYLVPDMIRIRHDALGGIPIDGIEVYEETNVSTRV